MVPIGAYKMIPTHELIPNPDFRGLKIQNSKSLDNFLHLRYPKLEEQRTLIGNFIIMQNATKPSNVTTSWTPSVKTKSRKAGPSKPMNLALKSHSEVCFGKAMLDITGPTRLYLEELTWDMESGPRTYSLLCDYCLLLFLCFWLAINFSSIIHALS